MATEHDPWDWSVEEVINYFNRFRLFSIDYRPHSSLPAAHELEKLLKSHDINGSTLLSDIDSTVLREDFRIWSFGQRSAIVYAIKLLRQKSTKYKVRSPLFLEPSPTVASPSLSGVSLPANSPGTTVTEQPLNPVSIANTDLPARQLTLNAEPQDLNSTSSNSNSRVRPGETLVEDQFGRKRRRLILPPTSHSAQGIDTKIAQNGNIVSAAPHNGAANEIGRLNDSDGGDTEFHNDENHFDGTTSESRTNIVQTSARDFLGPKAISIDRVFYGDTKFGQPISDNPWKNMADIQILHGVEDEFQVSSGFNASPGYQHFVCKSLKYYFSRAEEREIFVDGTQVLAIYPYPDRLVREGSRRSVTIFKSTDGEFEAVRDDALLPGQLAQEDTPEISDWDRLARWQNEDSTLLPQWGDSDSEAEYSSGLIQEMEEEEREEKEAKKQKSGPLPLERVAEVIEEEIRKLQESWKIRKLPLRESSARSTWFKAGGPRNRAYFVSSITAEIERLNARMAKLKNNILGEVWMKDSEVKQQCEILEETVFELQESQFKKSIWEAPSPPPALKKPATRGKPNKKTNSQGGYLVNSDSELETADIDDFVLPDDPIGDEAQEHLSADMELENNLSAPEERASSSVSNATDQEADSEDIDMRDPISSAPSQSQDIKEELLEGMDETADGATVQSDTVSPTKKSHDAVIIELNSSCSEHEEEPCKDNGKSREIDIYYGEPESATTEHVSSWLWSDLIERNDRKRLIMKVLLALNPRRYNDLRSHVLKLSEEEFTGGFKRTTEALRRVNEVSCEPADINMNTMSRFVKLYVCWILCLHKYWENSASAELQDRLNDDQVKNLTNYKQFYDFVNAIFMQHKTPIIFSLGSPDKDFKNPLNGREDLISISSGSESQSLQVSDQETDDELPISKGKKVVAESKEAKEKRERAQLRKKEQEERERILKSQLGNMSANTDQIIVNTAKNDEHEFIYLNPHIGSRIKKHQIEGLQFMWREIVNAGLGLKRSEMQGCLLAHTMGLGKTMQAIALIVTIAECAKSGNSEIASQIPDSLKFSRTLILCPSSLIMNWQDELLLWTPLPRSNNIGEINFLYTDMKLDERLETVNEWYEKGGVLTVSYDLLRQMIANKPKKANKGPPLDEARHSKLFSQLIDGPNIIIADEAHKMKNLNSRTSEVTSRFVSRSRVALTGSPLANNLKEYFAMIDWIAPGYLGNFVEFKSRYQDPIEHGLYATSSKAERRAALKKLQVLKINLEPKIHRADITVLKGSLKPKAEFVISISLTTLQEDAYRLYVRHLLASSGDNVPVARVWSWLAILSLLCNHPKIFLQKLHEQTKSDKKSGCALTASNEVNIDQNLSDEQISRVLESLGDEHVSKIGISTAMIREQESLIQRESELQSPRHSQKVVLFMQILNLSMVANDKVLVFSHSIPTLDYLESLFIDKKIRYSRLDGGTKMGSRNAMAHDFNEGKTAVFLISTRAGGLGFNLPGANRVVLFDFNFNPTWEEQAIGRAYRIGQEKPVYVYRFVSAGTFETNIYNKAVFKTQLASRVVDKKNPKSHASKSKDYLYEPRHTPAEDVSGVIGKDPVVLDQILEARQQGNDTHIRSITTTETLQADAGDDLTEAELQEVYKMSEEENLRKDNPQAYEARRIAAQMALFNESARTHGVNSMKSPTESSHPPANIPNVTQGGVTHQVPVPIREVQAPVPSTHTENNRLPANAPGPSREILRTLQNGASTSQKQAAFATTQTAKANTHEITSESTQRTNADVPDKVSVPVKQVNGTQNDANLATQRHRSNIDKYPMSATQQAKTEIQKNLNSPAEHTRNDTQEKLTTGEQQLGAGTQEVARAKVHPAKVTTHTDPPLTAQQGEINRQGLSSAKTQRTNDSSQTAPYATRSEPKPSDNTTPVRDPAKSSTGRRAAYSRANWKLKNTPFAYEETPKRGVGRPRKSEPSTAEAVAKYKEKIATAVKEKDAASTSRALRMSRSASASSSRPASASASTTASGAKSKGSESRRGSGDSGARPNTRSGSANSFQSPFNSRPSSASGMRRKSDTNRDNEVTDKSRGAVKSTVQSDDCTIV